MKKCLSFILVICMLATSSLALATDTYCQRPEMETSSAAVETVKNTPVYITYINPSDETHIQSVKEEVTMVVNNIIKGISTASEITNEYEIVKISDAQKNDMLTSSLLSSTFNNVQKLVDEGITINYINIFLPNNIKDGINTYSNQNDPAYWEEHFPRLGEHNGYKFLYQETAVGVESKEVTPGELSAEIKWDVIIKKAITVTLDHFVKGAYYKAVKVASGYLSTLFKAYKPPISIGYGESNGYVKAKVSGDLYLRTVYISDNLNRISGYAYYEWGSTAKLVAAVRVDAKYPISKNVSGTYNYVYPSETTSTQSSNTPGYYGNTTFYSSVIQLYKNDSGHFKHTESIDVYSVVASLLD